MKHVVRNTREQQAAAAEQHVQARFAAERRTQLLALVVLAALVLAGTVLYAGVRNVFLPGWWRVDLWRLG